MKHGHAVMIGTRDPKDKEVADWLASNSGAKAGTFADAASFGEVLLLAVKGQFVERVIELAKPENFTGKTLIDANNPIADGPPVQGVVPFTTGPNESLGERIQALIPKAHVVKAFNSVGSALMVNPHFEQGTPSMFFCGDNDGAKAQVSGIIRQFGWEPFDCGGIIASRAIEPLCMLWLIPGFSRNEWTHAFKVLTK